MDNILMTCLVLITVECLCIPLVQGCSKCASYQECYNNICTCQTGCNRMYNPCYAIHPSGTNLRFANSCIFRAANCKANGTLRALTCNTDIKSTLESTVTTLKTTSMSATPVLSSTASQLTQRETQPPDPLSSTLMLNHSITQFMYTESGLTSIYKATSSSNLTKVQIYATIGGVIGGVFVMAILAAVGIIIIRRRNVDTEKGHPDGDTMDYFTTPVSTVNTATIYDQLSTEGNQKSSGRFGTNLVHDPSTGTKDGEANLYENMSGHESTNDIDIGNYYSNDKYIAPYETLQNHPLECSSTYDTLGK